MSRRPKHPAEPWSRSPVLFAPADKSSQNTVGKAKCNCTSRNMTSGRRGQRNLAVKRSLLLRCPFRCVGRIGKRRRVTCRKRLFEALGQIIFVFALGRRFLLVLE